MGANRRFGLVFFTILALIYIYELWHGRPGTGYLVAGIILGSITLLVPRVLQPLLKLWLKIGAALHFIVSPVLLVLFYFGAVLPIGLVLRLFGKDPLRLRRGGDSYWVNRRPPGPEPRTMPEVY